MIKIYRQYPIINGFVQLPPNAINTRTTYIVGNQFDDPVGTTVTNQMLNSIDAQETSVIEIKKSGKALEFLASQVTSLGT